MPWWFHHLVGPIFDFPTLSTSLDMFPDAPVLKEKGFFNQRTTACHRRLSIRDTAVVQEREPIFIKSRTIGVKYSGLEKNAKQEDIVKIQCLTCLLYTSPSPRDQRGSRMPSSA